MSIDSDDQIPIPPDKAYHLMKIEVLHDIQSEMTAWVKRKTTVFTIVAVIIGFFGLNGLVSITLYSFLKEDLRESHKSSVLASAAAGDATKAADAAQAMTETLDKKANDINRSLDRLSGRLKAESDNSRESALKEIGFLRKRVKEMEGVIASLSDNAQAVQARFAALNADRRKIEEETRQDFNVNSRFYVSFSGTDEKQELYKKVMQLLLENGYKAFGDLEPATCCETGDKISKIVFGARSKEAAQRISSLLEPYVGGLLPLHPVVEDWNWGLGPNNLHVLLYN